MSHTPFLHETLQLRTLYIRDFPRDDCARNVLEEKSTTRQGLICAEILPCAVKNGAAMLLFWWLAVN